MRKFFPAKPLERILVHELAGTTSAQTSSMPSSPGTANASASRTLWWSRLLDEARADFVAAEV